jgi:hypothetical protein
MMKEVILHGLDFYGYSTRLARWSLTADVQPDTYSRDADEVLPVAATVGDIFAPNVATSIKRAAARLAHKHWWFSGKISRCHPS